MKSGLQMSELLKKIAKGEGVQLDFKFRIDDQKKIARTLTAFANTRGGSLLIGVKDNGKVAGVDPEEEYHMIEGAGSMYCNPPIKVESKVWQEGHHMVLEIIVEASSTRHKSKDEKGEWKFYYRIDDHTTQGNKILDKLWYYREHGIERPETFSDDDLNILNVVRDFAPVSISKIYKETGLKKNKVDRFVSALIHWNIIDVASNEDGLRYSLAQ